MEKDFDFVAIGDITTDAFIRLSDADTHMDEAKNRNELCISFGDKIAYDFVKVVPAVGNCANASVAAARLGLKSALLTNQGDDEIGKSHLESLKKDNVSTDLVISHQGKESNYHYVLWFGSDRTILVKHHEYPYGLDGLKNPGWIYLTSLGPNTEKFHGDIENYLDNNPDVKLSFQPGTFQIQLGYEKLKKIYERAEIFTCNVQEAGRILDSKEEDGASLAKKINQLGPKIVVITDGPKGAHVYDSRDGSTYFMPIYPDPKPPYERTGAGDAYASTFTIAIAKGHDIETALKWAGINSMSVVQYIGAQEGLLDENKILSFLSDAPENYKPTKI